MADAVENGYTADDIQVLKGLGSGAETSGNVHWRYWRQWSAPFDLGGC